MLASFGWSAPAWTGAHEQPALLDDDEPVIFAAAMCEEAVDVVTRRLQVLTRPDAKSNVEASEWRVMLKRAQSALAAGKAFCTARCEEYALISDCELFTEELMDSVVDAAVDAGLPDDAVAVLLNHAGDAAEVVAWAEANLGPTSEELLVRMRRKRDRVLALRARIDAFPSPQLRDGHAVRDGMESIAREVFARLSMPTRSVPRAAPGEPGRGSFALPYTALCIMGRMVRSVAEADGALLAGVSDETVAASIRTRRARLIPVMERVASQSTAYDARIASQRIWSALISEPLAVARELGIKLPKDITERQDLAINLLAMIAERTDAPARHAAARLSALLFASAVSPVMEPQRIEAPAHEDHVVAIELSYDVHRALNPW